ncbi:MAG: response regulator transcription factor [Bacteroidia bacterium]
MHIRIGIVDDHTLFRNGMKALIEDMEGIEIVLEANHGNELLGKLRDNQPDVILMDIEMPVLNGLDATKAVKQNYPDIKTIALSTHDDDNFILAMIQEGACGYLLKTSEEDEVELAIKMVMEKGFYFNDRVSVALVKTFTQQSQINSKPKESIDLSERETKVLKMICEELTTSEIADKLNLGKRTVDGHRLDLLRKTGSKNTAGLVIFAIKNGYF